MYQNDAQTLFPDNTDVIPQEMPLTVLDEEYEMRDDWFTTPFGHPSYIVLDGDLRVRHKFVGPCCGYEDYYACTTDIATALDETLSGYIDNILLESGGLAEDNAAVTDDGSSAALEPPATVASCPATGFSEWSACSVTCGTGIQFRWRMVTPANGASLDSCPAPVETQPCVAELAQCALDGCLADIGETWEVVTVASGFDGARDVAL